MKKEKLFQGLAIALTLAMPILAFASVESSLHAIQDKLVNTILPLCAILGLVAAGISFVMGNERARAHLMLAVIGAAIGFGAQSIVSFIQSLVH